MDFIQSTRPIALAIGLTILATNAAYAIGLGNIAVRSALGEPFRAEIGVLTNPSDQTPSSDCFKLTYPATDHADIPTLTPAMARVSLERRGAQSTLVVQSHRAINEPVLQLYVTVGCGGELTRSFQVLLDPPIVAPASPRIRARDIAQAAGKSATPSTAPAQNPAPASTAAAGSDAFPSQWTTQGADTAWSITRQLFPRQPRAQQRFFDALLRANPAVDFGVDGNQPIVSGQELIIPDTRRPRPAPSPIATDGPAAEARQRPTDKAVQTVRNKPAREPQRGDRLIISSGEPDPLLLAPPQPPDEARPVRLPLSGEFAPLRMSDAIASHNPERTTESQRSILRMEYQLLIRLQEQGEQQLALAEKVRALEAATLDLDQSVRTALESRSRSGAALHEQIAKPDTAGPVAASSVRHTQADTRSGGDPPWFLILLLAPLGWLGWRIYRSRKTAKRPAFCGTPKPTDSPATSVEEAFFSDAPTPRAVKPIPPPIAPVIPLPVAPAGGRLADPPPATAFEVVEDPEFANVLELADVMLAFGRVRGAIEALEDCIDAHPDCSLRIWLKLLKIFREQDMRSEFEALTERLRESFNLISFGWDEIGQIVLAGHSLQELEALEFDDIVGSLPSTSRFPHVLETLRSTWNTPECLDYVKRLLRDNRNGERVGFTLATANELVAICELLESRLAQAA